MILVLVTCGANKSRLPQPAGKLYRGPLFNAAKALATRSKHPWKILSAKHGVLSPQEVVYPYDQTLRTMPKPARVTWGAQVRDTLLAETAPGDKIIVLAGSLYYVEWLEDVRRSGRDVVLPLQGLSLGRAIQKCVRIERLE